MTGARRNGDPVAITVESEAETRRLAQDIAALLRAGDLVTLSGDLGVGKSALARGIIRYWAGDPDFEVPSPTFAVRIDYDLPGLQIAHADLYRLLDVDDIAEIGLDDALSVGAVLVEWPERLVPAEGTARLDISIAETAGGTASPETDQLNRRVVTLAPGFDWRPRLQRLVAMRRFMAKAGWEDAERRHVAGDVSGRAYRRLVRNAETRIVMDSPPRVESPPDQGGLSFEAATRRAMDIRPFIAIDEALRTSGFRAPEIHTADVENGLLVLEDLGSDAIVDAAGNPIPERYEAAIDVLAALHTRTWPRSLTLVDGSSYSLPPYDLRAFLAEIALFADWHAGRFGRPEMADRTRAGFLGAWSELLAPYADMRESWVLLDYHSPNLLWLPPRSGRKAGSHSGVQRIGILDFQDTLLGCCAYDVASLAQDARAPVSVELQAALRARYVTNRKSQDSLFDSDAFHRAFTVLGTQRLTKVIGAFSRLQCHGNQGYERYIPIAQAALMQNLEQPVMAPIRGYYNAYF